MSAVERLRQNNPARTSISICLFEEPSDADLALALQQNPFITTMDLFLGGARDLGWDSLLQVIATRVNLEKVTLQQDRNAALVSAILRAIQQNFAVQSVLLISLRLPTDLSTFVDTASSITLFDLFCCDMEPSLEREQGARDLAAALQRNTNIKTLRLGFMGDIYVIPILQSLQANVSLTSLTISGGSYSDATTRVIQQLLESSASIEHFDARGPKFSGDEFRPVSQGIVNSRSVSKVTLGSCNFKRHGIYSSVPKHPPEQGKLD